MSVAMNRRLAIGALGSILLFLLAATSGTAKGAVSMPNRDEVHALYVMDHYGRDPRSDADLLVYLKPFQRILAGCRTSVEALTNRMLDLSDQASINGGRIVTNLQMLESIARRITWRTPKGCGYIYNVAEAYREAGVG